MQPAGALDGLNILIIADAFDSVESLVESLRSVGAVVVVVRSAQLALAYSERHTVDVILVDLREAGWWLAPEIRAVRSLSRAKMYAMTEAGQQMPDATADIAGYFLKPMRVDALIATLAALRRRPR